MTRLAASLLATLAGWLAPATAGAVALQLSVTAGSPLFLNPGDPLGVDVVVTGLGEGVPPTVGPYDLTVLFPGASLALTGFAYGTALDAPLFPSIEIPPVFTASSVKAGELASSCPDVEAAQGPSAMLFHLDFEASAPGQGTIGFADDPPGNGFFLFDCQQTPQPLPVSPPELRVRVRAAEPALVATGAGAGGLLAAGRARRRWRG